MNISWNKYLLGHKDTYILGHKDTLYFTNLRN